MYPSFQKKFLKDVESKKLFIIAGEDDYFRFESKKHLLNLFKELPVATLIKPSLDEVESELSTFDLFADEKVILVEDFEFISTTSNKKIEDADMKRILDVFSKSDNIVIVYNDGKLDKRKKISKEMLKLFHFIDCSPIGKKEMQPFLEYLNNQHNTGLPKNVIQDLSIYLEEGDLYLINKEFEKLALYPDKISKENIYEMLSINNNQKIFDLMDKMIAGNTSQSIAIYDNLLFNKQSEYQIYHFLSSQFTHLLKIKMIKESKSGIDIAKTLGIHPFMAKKLEQSSKSFSLDGLMNTQKLLLETDLKIKQGLAESVEAVRFLILSITELKGV